MSALRPAFFILYLESFISRLNVIPCHDLTLSVSEPDNAAAQTGAGTSFGATGDSHVAVRPVDEPILRTMALVMKDKRGLSAAAKTFMRFILAENIVQSTN